ncbi:DNA replication protein DnaC [Pelomonas aquatica]|uniref:DNA replication protein DnaC n=1 Tax=Pelomonas aquatica TaxID=431058 RepID=A0ABU1ZFU5_9BURK|nr:IS21-like element helper ATPase IstB [Pelomonas aquatica]MDR7299510.1 DNA replication protein DnaC [Pelomonas aquatica]
MSSAQQTLARMRELHLGAMAEAYEHQLQQPRLHEMSFEDRLALLVEHEASQRHDRKLKRLFRAAALPDAAALEDLDPRAQRGTDRAQIASLGSCDWIRRQQNLIIHGATGVGKTWLACALAGQACRLDIPVLFYRASELCSTIRDRAHEGALPKLKLALAKPSLLVLDDLGLGEIDTLAGQFLLELVDRRQRTGSLLITSQYPTEKWHAFFPDPTVADAVLDRIVHKAHRITLKGESMRKVLAKKMFQAV